MSQAVKVRGHKRNVGNYSISDFISDLDGTIVERYGSKYIEFVGQRRLAEDSGRESPYDDIHNEYSLNFRGVKYDLSASGKDVEVTIYLPYDEIKNHIEMSSYATSSTKVLGQMYMMSNKAELVNAILGETGLM